MKRVLISGLLIGSSLAANSDFPASFDRYGYQVETDEKIDNLSRQFYDLDGTMKIMIGKMERLQQGLTQIFELLKEREIENWDQNSRKPSY